jgi:cohesin domain
MRAIKKITAFLLAMVMVLSLVPSAFAAEGDSPMVITTVDKTAVKPGETITVTYTLDHDLDKMTRLDIALRFDASLVQFEGTDFEGSVWYDNPTQNEAIVSGDENFVRIKQNKNRNTATIAAGKICSITFKALEEISTAQSALFYNNNSGLTISGIRVNAKYYYVDGTGFASGVDDPITVNIMPDGSSITVPKVETGYSVSMGADQQVAAGQQVRIPVTVASSEKKITGFNAYDMTFTYDPTALTLNTKTGDAANLTVEDNNGTVRVHRYGETMELGTALTLDFTANKATSSTVTLTAAKFDIDANSINFDAPKAAISDADTVVNANNFTVTLPDAFTSDETRLVPGGGSFTFKPVDSRYTYTFTVKMGDTITEGLTFGANDTYTIENISGNVEVTCTGKTPKQYDVEYVFGGKDPLLEKDVTKGPEKATYLQDYSVIVTPRAGLSYWIHYEIRYPNGTRSDQVSLTPVANADGTITYTIPGSKIDGTVYFIISTRTNDEYPGYAVLVTGNGAEDQAPGNETSVPRDMPYYLQLNERENCTYTVTAYYQPLGSITAVNMPAKVRSLGNGKYVVDPIPYNKLSQYAYSWRLVVNVEKVSQNAEEVSVSRYLELNDKTMMLITVKGTPEGGKAFTYDGNTMYKVNAYGTDQYAWLVIVDKGQTLTQEEAAAKVAISAADNVVTITQGFDVNMTGKVDVNDAQLVYDMYNGTYRDFTKVSVEKFLRADVNATKVVDHTDAVAIANQFN